VNKVSSRVELRFDLEGTTALPDPVKARLRIIARGLLDAEGRVLIKSERTRDQRRNLEDAREKLRALVAQALVVPKRRRATKPSRAAKQRLVRQRALLPRRRQADGSGRPDLDRREVALPGDRVQGRHLRANG